MKKAVVPSGDKENETAVEISESKIETKISEVVREIYTITSTH